MNIFIYQGWRGVIMAKNTTKKKQKETSALVISIDDKDFNLVKDDESVVVSSAVESLERTDKSATTTEDIENIRKALPGVIAKKILQIVPEGFELSELSFSGEVAGKPLGIGVSGQVSVVFKKSSKSQGER